MEPVFFKFQSIFSDSLRNSNFLYTSLLNTEPLHVAQMMCVRLSYDSENQYHWKASDMVYVLS